MANNKNIQYINKDFGELRASLIDYAKTYFPNTYNDFTPSSPGLMFMEMAAYVGDVLSFYLDNQIQENFLQYARETQNLYELAYMFGYKPNVTQVATTVIDIFQEVPAQLSGSTYVPDFNYCLYIEPNSIVTQTSPTKVPFLIQDGIDFSVSSSGDPTQISILEISGVNPTKFLLKKQRKAISATINTTTFDFTTPVPFATVGISSPSIVGILDVYDSDGNEWYEVDYLGQEMVYKSIKNTNPNDPTLSQYQGDTPYLLQLEQVQRRFVTRFVDSGSLQIQFGSGNPITTDELIVPNPDNVGLGLPFEQSKLTTAYSPSNFLYTKTYGIAPSQTTLTVRYLTGGGVTSNVPANTLISFVATPKFLNSNLANSVTANAVLNSLAVTNPLAADGGGDGDTVEEIRQNSSANFASQLRNVTQDDYLVRALSMPASYGVISKAYIEPTKAITLSAGESNSVLDLYVLSYNVNNQLTLASPALKDNITTYLSQYRMVNDAVSIKDAFIINIGVNFDIIVLPNFNSNEVLINCITALQDYFRIDKWQINQPIILRDIYVLLDRINGVQTVKNVAISNLVGTNLGYSPYAYSMPSATIANVIYPSLDPSIFEVKYPNSDIQGRIVSL
jgi:hypothetical protein